MAKITAQELYQRLKDEFNLVGAEGSIRFNLRNSRIVVEQNNVVGNILEEWLAKWMWRHRWKFVHNLKQSAPDFWLNPDDLNSDWLEVKSFTGSPSFDISAFMSYIKEIIAHPWKLHSNYLLLKYKMENGLITVEDFWLKNVWEICSTSAPWPIKVQCKSGVINNIRPCTWYSEKTDFNPFDCMEDFIAALEQTIYKYRGTNHLAETWADRLKKSYKNHYGIDLDIPRWNDVKHKYLKD